MFILQSKSPGVSTDAFKWREQILIMMPLCLAALSAWLWSCCRQLKWLQNSESGKKPVTTQTIQKELTASGIITCIRWKPRSSCLLEQNWQGETGNHRRGKLRFSFLGRCCIQMPGYGLKLLSICGEKALKFYSPWSLSFSCLQPYLFFLRLILLITFFYS